MNIKEGIEKRFSVRAFTDEVPKLETIKEILKTANAAPSGGNIQPWKVYVLSEKAKKRLAEKTLYNLCKRCGNNEKTDVNCVYKVSKNIDKSKILNELNFKIATNASLNISKLKKIIL